MFQGTIPTKALKIINQTVKEWDVKRIFVGCSGNFTIERAISNVINCPIVSNDVTIYSSYIGKFLAGESLDCLRVRSDYEGDCEFLKDYMTDDVSKISTLILAADVLQYSSKYGQNGYQRRMLKGYKEQFGRMHVAMCKKMSALSTKVDGFYKGDVMKMLDEIPENSGFVSFPPFFKGGYEKMWAKVEEFFEFDEPEYELFDPEKHIEAFCEKVEKCDNFCICTERPVALLHNYMSGVTETTQGKMIYIYSKSKKKHFISNNMKKTKATPIIKISENDEIKDDIEIRQITLEQFEENRALYLSTNVKKVATPSASYGLFSDNKLFGIFAYANSMMLSPPDVLEKPCIYLLTDFAISPTKEKHLSKLVLYCILSKEAKGLAEKLTNKRINSISTNAFSNNPVSMKYRGVFEQYGRRAIEKDAEGNVIKWNLTYGAKMGQWTLKEAYKKWKRKS